ncbi:MAG TPA: hypothetical protein VLK82_07420 [Candidatus Tectomicrobia bacterium]|nr:hypothetical protein [Candidatus Tectomicrobia bacterium]
MPRGSQPGERRGGRRKGTPNKRSLKTREELWAYIEAQIAQGHTANPFQVLVDTMLTSPTERVQCAIALADRLLPKLKAVEISGDPDRPLTLTDAAARQARIAQLLEKHTNGAHGG